MWTGPPIGKASVDGMYAANCFEPDDFFHTLEVQVTPAGLFVYIGTNATYRARRRSWTGERGLYAAVIGRLLCLGLVSPHEFAAWVDGNPSDPAGGRDTEFNVAHWFRLVPWVGKVRDTFKEDGPAPERPHPGGGRL